MGIEPRPEIARLPVVEHGGDAPAGILDFSTGVSPLPTPAAILQAAREADLSRYPHPTALPLRLAVSAVIDIAPEAVVAGAGSVELIWALARTFGGLGRTGLVVTPAFGEYAQALRASGARVVNLPLTAPRFEVDEVALEASLEAHAPALVFLGRPSNPTLGTMPLEALYALAHRWPGTLFVSDEAYQPLFDDDAVTAARPLGNLVVLRSLTKIFALPGLRLGYLLASREVAAAVQKALPPWNVSSPAQAAGAIAVELVGERGAALREELGRLRRALTASLLPVAGPPARSGGSFLLYRVGDGEDFMRRLLERGVKVRACTSFGLPEYVRLGVRNAEDNAALSRAWSAAADERR